MKTNSKMKSSTIQKKETVKGYNAYFQETREACANKKDCALGKCPKIGLKLIESHATIFSYTKLMAPQDMPCRRWDTLDD